MWAHMGYDAACVHTIEMIMKSWISPHLFGVQLTGRLCVCVLERGVVVLLVEVCRPCQ